MVRLAPLVLALVGAWVALVPSGAGEDERGSVRSRASLSAGAAPSAVERPLTAPWCAERSAADRPAATPGAAVRLVLALPSDAPDRFAVLGKEIAADVEAIEAWWRREDPGRVPRFDRYAADCGPQLDITVVRLGEDTRYFRRFAVDANLIESALFELGLDFDRRVTLVFWDGPVSDPEVCGEGGGDAAQLLGHGVVFLEACADRDRARIAAHELIHALGALAAGAPHPCPGDDGHPCDSRDDLLWPTVDTRALEDMRLDVGRDDYYGHRGAWPDVRDSAYLRRLDVPPTRLVLMIRGVGTVSSPVLGLACDRSCVSEWDAPVSVPLERRAGPGMRFVRFEGACTGRGCRVALAGSVVRVSAVFAPPTYDLVVQPSAGGRVLVPGRVCTTRCAGAVPSYSTVRLRAEPAPGYAFSHWRGDCRGRVTRCVLPMERSAFARAVFVRAPG